MVLSNGPEHVRNAIQWHQNSFFLPKNYKKSSYYINYKKCKKLITKKLQKIQLKPKIFNYHCNYSSSSNCNSITIKITMKKVFKHFDQFTYIPSFEFCLCQHCGFVVYFYTTPIKAPFLSVVVLPPTFV